MPQASSTDRLFARAAAKIADTFGERTEHGELAEVKCCLPDGKPVELVGVIVGNAKTGEPEPSIGVGGVGALQCDRTRKFSVPKAELDRRKVDARKVHHFEFEGEVWPVDRVENEDAAIVDFETSQPVEREGNRARSR